MSELDSDFEDDFSEVTNAEEISKKQQNNSKKRKKTTKNIGLAEAVESESSESEIEPTLLDAFSESMEKPISDITYENIGDYDFKKELSDFPEHEKNDFSEKTVNKTTDTEYLENTMKEYNRQFQEDVKLTTFNLKEKAQMEASIKAKWASILQSERTRGKLLTKARDTLIESLKEDLSSGMMAGSYMSARQQIDAAINSNEHVRKMRQDISDNKQIVELLEMYWIVIQGFGFTIKNSIETMKLDMGI